MSIKEETEGMKRKPLADLICSFRSVLISDASTSPSLLPASPSSCSVYSDIKFTGHMSRLRFLHKHINSHLTYVTHTEFTFTLTHTHLILITHRSPEYITRWCEEHAGF